MEKFFRFYVKGQDGNIEMEIGYWKYGEFTVHYPRYENSAPKFRANTCFARMNSYQVAMLIFAYSESEYFRFVEEMEKFYKELGDEQ